MSCLTKAKDLLQREGYTCVFCHGDEVISSRDRGVKPLVMLYESGRDVAAFSVADKVVGQGAAYLYLLLGVKHLYAEVISTPAFALLKENGVSVTYKTQVPHIQNRVGDGYCPFEMAVASCKTPHEAYQAILAKMDEMHISH